MGADCRRRYVLHWLVLLLIFQMCAECAAQVQQDGKASSTNEPLPQMISREEPVTFKVKVNLVMVPVIVRDSKGRPVGNLHGEDFELIDEGKPQQIRHFEAITPATRVQRAKTSVEGSQTGAAALPQRFFAYIFDDVHLRFEDLSHTRAALDRHLSSFQPTDRVALYTPTGKHMIEFTDDVAKLREELFRMTPFLSAAFGVADCPALTYYAADRIEHSELENPDMPFTASALQQKCGKYPSSAEGGRSLELMAVSMAARQTLERGDREAEMSLQLLKEAVRRLSEMPGERTIVFISSGLYLRSQDEIKLNQIIDAATRAHITVNTLSARGLEVLVADADASIASSSEHSTGAAEKRLSASLVMLNATAIAEPLGDLSKGTGGVFLRNNDFDGLFESTVAPPEYSYLLGFTPRNLKANGSFHRIKVRLRNRQFTVQARRGYFVPKRSDDPAEATRQDVETAMFAQDEIREIPIAVRTQYLKSGYVDAVLSIFTKLDISKLPLRRDQDRNNDNLAVYAALFDRNGNYVTGKGQTIEMHLKDDTLARYASGIDVKTSFDVKTGNYLLRVVVRDSEGALISAVNKAVQID